MKLSILTVMVVVYLLYAVHSTESLDLRSSLDGFIDTVSAFFDDRRDTKVGENVKPVVKKEKRKKRQTSQIGDESLNMYEVRSSSLPLMSDKVTINTRYVPTLSNGNIGLTVYGDTMYLNGLYSGTGSIPAILMTRINLTTPEIERKATRKFTMNARDGYYMETIDCDFAYIEHRMYTHQKYIRLYVNDIYVRMKTQAIGGGTLTMKYPSMNQSADIVFDTPRYYLGNWEVRGVTNQAEAGESVQTFFIFYMLPLTQISVSGSNMEANYTHIMAVDKTESNARSEFDQAQTIIQQERSQQGNYKLFMEHVNAWRDIYNTGRIEVTGDTQLAKTTWFSQYYILSSLPSPKPYLPPLLSEVYYGCSRTGLGKGMAGKDYQGHVMWDSEMYIMPAILQFQPNMAKQLLRYRSAMAKRASDNSKLYQGKGYNFPWESGFSGNELAPGCPADPQCNWRKMFTTAAISWGIRQYYSATRDRDYMINPLYNGCDMTREIARFFSNQAIYNPNIARYDMYNQTGPDDWHPNHNNNVFTLCAASLAIHWARYFACLCNRNEREEVPDEAVHKAMYLNLPFDNVKRLHYEYDGWNPTADIPIKQADTVMLNYPLNWNYSQDIMKNDLMFYETLMSDRSPAMTWSWFTIGWKWVHEESKMRSYFLKSYQDYLIQPFKIWTEYSERNQADQDIGNVNFLPGMGAFLQSLVYGFAGVRIRPDQLQVFEPRLPPGATKLALYGFKYLGNNFTFIIEQDKVTVIVYDTNPLQQLVLKVNTTNSVEQSLNTGTNIVISPAQTGFSIYPSLGETCEFPRDYIFMPWGYSPYVNAAYRPTTSIYSLLIYILSLLTVSTAAHSVSHRL